MVLSFDSDVVDGPEAFADAVLDADEGALLDDSASGRGRLETCRDPFRVQHEVPARQCRVDGKAGRWRDTTHRGRLSMAAAARRESSVTRSTPSWRTTSTTAVPPAT